MNAINAEMQQIYDSKMQQENICCKNATRKKDRI